ncbi:ABC transporter ATP-binding protein [Streptomyces sp. NBC_01474]|uniref:ABC transporter ATP-binding protein n=1 Tax=Streptomyces sp. NBC_01474 TaxID=2903880 RepID=UPI002DDAB581|nr:ABC transporter ATP-binding protein [Streptomyces sp. NBC_01474]WSD94877.1 ABC transporter ATP-binding protein [Streptomyces sp. NBC_01474]
MKLTALGIESGYGSATVLRGVDLTVGNGEAVGVVGRNGMGKTTLLETLLGFIRPTAGTVHLGGEDITGRLPERTVGRGVAYGPQDEPVFAALSVEENIVAAKAGRIDLKRRSTVLELFPVLGTRLRQRAGTLSGGEQKMLVLARALLADPTLIVLDEITAGLQPSMVDTVVSALRWERQERGTGILLVEQNIDATLGVCDRVAVMKLGRLVAEEPAAEEAREHLLRLLAP